MADRTEACPTASHQQRSGAPIAARAGGRVLSVARSHRLILLADAAGRAPHVVVQSGEPCANQSKYRQWQRASGSHGRVQNGSCGTHNNECWNGQHNKDNQLTSRKKQKQPTLGEVVGESWYFIKTISSQTNTHCQRKATATDVGPSTLGIQRRITSDTCPTLFTQLRSNTNKSLISLLI